MGLDDSTMNSNIRIFFNHTSFQAVVGRTLRQNEILFRDQQLQVYVADYTFQLVSKLDRMSTRMNHPDKVLKDSTDAAYYLRKHTAYHGKPTRAAILDGLHVYRRDGYMPVISEAAIDNLATAYQAAYGESEAPFA